MALPPAGALLFFPFLGRPMRHWKVLVVAALVQLSSFAQAAPSRTGGPLGLGLILGEPTALNLKYDSDELTAFDAGLSFNFDKWLLLYGDYQYKFPGVFSNHRGLSQITPYVGVGLVVVVSNRSIDETRHYQYFTDSTSSKFALGIRIPVGFEWRPSLPIGLFAEVAPGIAVIPGTIAFFEGGVGIRYYF
jgi:hypothetical protein